MILKGVSKTKDYKFTDLVYIIIQAGKLIHREGLSDDVISGLRISIGDKRSDGGYEIRLYEPESV